MVPDDTTAKYKASNRTRLFVAVIGTIHAQGRTSILEGPNWGPHPTQPRQLLAKVTLLLQGHIILLNKYKDEQRKKPRLLILLH